MISRLFSRERWPVFLGSERFQITLKKRFFPKKAQGEVPGWKELAPDRGTILGVVLEYYRVRQEELLHSRRGFINEARNMANYLTRMLRGDTFREIGFGFGFGIDRYSTVSSVVERMKAMVEEDEKIRARVGHLISMIIKSQEQT